MTLAIGVKHSLQLSICGMSMSLGLSPKHSWLGRAVNCQTHFITQSQSPFLFLRILSSKQFLLLKTKMIHWRRYHFLLCHSGHIFSAKWAWSQDIQEYLINFHTWRSQRKSYPVLWEFPYKIKLITSEKSCGWNVLLGALLMWLLNAKEISWISVWLLLL